jgi:hypothetical protein
MNFTFDNKVGVAGGLNNRIDGVFGARINLQTASDAVRTNHNGDVSFGSFESLLGHVLYCTASAKIGLIYVFWYIRRTKYEWNNKGNRGEETKRRSGPDCQQERDVGGDSGGGTFE